MPKLHVYLWLVKLETRFSQTDRCRSESNSAYCRSLLPVCLHAAFPKLQGDINDGADVLDAKTRTELGVLLRDVEQQTTAEIALVTVPSLDGMTVEEYANRLFKEWGIGRRARQLVIAIL
jgi:uncharacterized membrane protein YgcG